MSLFVPFKRATLLIPSGPAHDPERKYLFVLLTDPIESPDYQGKQVLLVSIASVSKGLPYDATCIIQPAEHRFIKHESYVFYAKARIEAANKLLDGVKAGLFTSHDLMDHILVQRISDGLQQSPHTTPKVLRFYELTTKNKHG